MTTALHPHQSGDSLKKKKERKKTHISNSVIIDVSEIRKEGRTGIKN